MKMKRVCRMLVLLILFAVSSVALGEIIEPNDISGICYSTSGTAQASGSCPSWFPVIDREGTEEGGGGHLIVELNACQVGDYEVFTMEQDARGGFLADLEPDDIIIVWDEDEGHSSLTSFYFSGTLVDVNDVLQVYIQISSPHSTTNWMPYRVQTAGTLTINFTGNNEHEAIHFPDGVYLSSLEKTDGISGNDCQDPNDEITYEICWENLGEITFEDAYIIDYLPAGVDFDSASDGGYYTARPVHTCTWELGNIGPGQSDERLLTVTVTEKAEPGMNLHNVAKLWADGDIFAATAMEDTPVCCWADPNIIYVDMTASGNNTGLSWQHAYWGEEGLQKALTRASESTCDVGLYTVYVAQGTYSPGDYAESSFKIPEGTKVYGGFMAGGSEGSGRDPEMYETVLTGYKFVDDDPNEAYHYHVYNDTVVTMENQYVSDPNFPVDETTILDGFTITDAVEYGVYGTDVDFDIANCTVADNGEYGIYGEGADITIENCAVTDSGLQGIYAADGNVTVKWSKIKNNVEDGIYHTGEGNTITIENCQIISNKQYGVLCEASTPTIKNSVIFGNGYDGDFEGIRILLPTEAPVLYNNTIVYNALEGIYCYDETNIDGDPNLPDYPDIQNCILYYNNTDGDVVGDQITITLPQMPLEYERDDYATYCDIQGYAEINDNHNINDVPGFVMSYEQGSEVNPYHYHLAYDSVCVDVGNANGVYDGQRDIDKQFRVLDGDGDDESVVDMGADEYCDEGESNDADFNDDGIVAYYDFSVFADAWLTSLGEEDYNPDCDLNDDDYIDYGDFAVFANDWLWQACWKMLPEQTAQSSQQSMMMVPMAMETTSFEIVPEPVERTTAQTVAFVEGIYDIIEYLDATIEEGHENAENLYEIKTFLEGVLLDLQAER